MPRPGSPLLRPLRSSDHQVMPWKDRGGTTTQIALEPPGSTLADAFHWRLSSARVERSGPFSRFPGMRRLLALVEGPGMDLAFEDGTLLSLDDPLRPVAFDGALAVHATLRGGPCVDLGVIYDPTKVACDFEILEVGTEAQERAVSATTLVVALAEGLEAHGIQLQTWDAVRTSGSGVIAFRATRGRTRLASVCLRPLDPGTSLG